MRLGYSIEEQTLLEGYDRKTGWFQPRIGWMPPRSAVLTMARNQLWGSDIFTAVHVSPEESWVVTSECMQGDAKNPQDLALTESRGANNRVILVRLRWSAPNRLAK